MAILRNFRRVALRYLAPVFFRLLNRWSTRQVVGEADVVVSLTTHGARWRHVFMTIESIALGTCRPRTLELWVDQACLDQGVPQEIQRLKRRGLSVLVTEDLGPHTKYFPHVSCSELNCPLVTADDDIVYPPTWLDGLMKAHGRFPDLVHCYRALRIELDELGMKPYSSWELAEDATPSVRNFALGVSGILYPVAVQRALKEQGDDFRRFAPKADDVWLHANTLRCGTAARLVDAWGRGRHFPLLPFNQDVGLWNSENQDGGNDEAISRVYSDSDLEIMRFGP